MICALVLKKWSFSISKVSTRLRCRAERRRAATSRAPVHHHPLGVHARGHRRPRQPAIPGRAPSPGCCCAPRRPDCPAPRASPSLRRTRATHVADRRSVRGLALRAPAEERCSTATSRPSSPHHHRWSTALPIKGTSASPRAGTKPPATIAVLTPSSILHTCSEPPNHVFPFLRPC
jgi:hypothetical protein